MAYYYTDEEKVFFRSYAFGHSYVEIAEEYTKRFKRDITPAKVKGCLRRYGAITGHTGRYEKGHIPYDKGLKQSEYMTPEAIERTKKSRFKKGQAPFNAVSIGTEVINTEGYIKVKVGEPNIWKFKNRLIWEEHNGPIPDGCYIMFKDSDKSNCDIDNLMLVTKEEYYMMFGKKLTGHKGDIKVAAHNTAKLLCELERRKKHENIN